ncbi:hypothetical protein [Nocardia jejuensis]|uniref:hypothetical protein n=1 Tax=Nocardia jejuensis TaxID=328049 RepID=UPI00082E4B06|nr:hypothetical protein [Nocardia jejuensis]
MSTTPEPQKNTGDGGRSSLTLVLAVGVLVLILVGSLGVWLMNRDADSDTANTPASSEVGSPAAGGPAPTGFAAPDVDALGRRVDIPNNKYGQPLAQTRGPLTAADPNWLTAAPVLPEQGGWQRVFNVSVPFSTSDGPTALVDNIPTGYSHTPQGAALAAVYASWQAVARPGDWSVREHMQVLSDSDHDEFDRMKATGKVPDLAPAAATKWLVAPDAFQIESWSASGDLCVLRVATKKEPDVKGSPQWLSSQLVMVWDGNWRLRLAKDGAIPKATINSLTGWTTW